MISFKGVHFLKEVILYAVFFYVRYGISYRGLEEIIEERGVQVDHATLNRWVIDYSPLIAAEAKKRKGFLLKPLREIAEAGGRTVEQKWAPLRVLQEVLAVKGCTDVEAKSLVLPMQKLHALRTEVRGHATTNKKRKAESEARTNFGTLRSHFTQIVTDCEGALAGILRGLDINLKS